MEELADRLELGIAVNLFLEEILDRLDVVIGGALDILDALRILFAELLDDVIQHMLRVTAQRRHFADFRVGGKRL